MRASGARWPSTIRSMPVPPWEEDEGSGEQSLIASDGACLQEVMMRFGLTFPTAGAAEAFVRFFGFAYTKSAVTVRDNVAWLSFWCAATDEREAALQAIVAVRTVTEHRLLLGGECPVGSHFYDARILGAPRPYELVRARAEREEALKKARAWGLLDDPLVQDADRARSSRSLRTGASRQPVWRRRALAPEPHHMSDPRKRPRHR
jgi:hypothetical protein